MRMILDEVKYAEVGVAVNDRVVAMLWATDGRSCWGNCRGGGDD